MKDIPECLSRRYRATDNLMQELSTARCSNSDCSSEEPGVKLMCQFWNILQEHPNLNLTQAVKEHLDLQESNSFKSQSFACYRASSTEKDENKLQSNNRARIRCECRNIDSDARTKFYSPKSSCTLSAHSSSAPPLSKALYNLKEAASFGKKCNGKIKELMMTQNELQDQINNLEKKEREGIELLKQADAMWTSMEESYKKKLAESLERQNNLLKQLKEADASNTKWRKNKKELEIEMNNLDKCCKEIVEKTNEKTNDVKSVDIEIDDLKKKIESNKKDLESTKILAANKKKTSDAKMSDIAAEVSKLEETLKDEQRKKNIMETEGNKHIKEAREDLQTLSKALLQKKHENEDLVAERETLLIEIETLKQMSEQCEDKCKDKEKSIQDEIKNLDKEIADFKIRCIQCHQNTDTIDVRNFCTDCPRCIEERSCLYDGDCCSRDKSMDCVCMYVKEKFLDNVFENMYKLLERHAKTERGKTIADKVLNCLKRSRNGKLDKETRKHLQDFIMSTIKKNLNLIIIGGATKTRCEMNEDTYNQLMLCLKQVKENRAPKSDKGTEAKKDPCPRWGDTSECNCPNDQDGCVCDKVFPEPTRDPGLQQSQSDDEMKNVRPHSSDFNSRKDSTHCDPNSVMVHNPNWNQGSEMKSSNVGAEVASWRPKPCEAPTCQQKNVRAVQCVLGYEALSFSNSRVFDLTIPCDNSILADQVTCNCGSSSTIPCKCRKDTQQLKVITNQCNKETLALNDDLVFPNYEDIPKTARSISIDNDAEVEKKPNKGTESEAIRNKSARTTKVNLKYRKTRSDDRLPILMKTPSENVKMIDDKKIFDEVKETIDNDFNIPQKGTKLDRVLEDYNNSKQISQTNKKMLISSTQSDALILETDKKPKSNFECTEIKYDDNNSIKCVIENGSLSINKDKIRAMKIEFQYNINNNVSGYLIRKLSENFAINMKSNSNLTNINENEDMLTSEDKEIRCPKRKQLKTNFKAESDSESLFPIQIKGFDSSNIQSFFLLRKKSMDTYEIILNKEFENIIKNTIKSHESDWKSNEEYIFELKESSSGRCLIEIKPKNYSDVEFQNEIKIKTSSRNVKSNSSGSLKENKYLNSNYSNSLIIKKASTNLPTKFHTVPASEFKKERTHRNPGMITKSKSDSNICMKNKNNCNKQCNIEVYKFLKRTNSGSYVLVFCKGFYNETLSNQTNKSNSLKIPNDLNKNADLNSRYKVTDKDENYNTVKKSSNTFVKYDSRENINVCVEKNLIKNTTSTICDSQPNAYCDISKCVCEKFDLQSWLPTYSNKDSDFQLFDSDYRKNCRKVQLEETDSLNLINTLSNTKHESYCCEVKTEKVLERSPDYYTKSSRLFKANRCKNMSQELIEHEELSECNVKTFVRLQSSEYFLWNSLERLPPQLPPFLRGYIHT